MGAGDNHFCNISRGNDRESHSATSVFFPASKKKETENMVNLPDCGGGNNCVPYSQWYVCKR